MRVLHFYKTYKPDSHGGAEQLIWQLCTGAAQRGIQADVMTVSKHTGTSDLGDHKHYRVREHISLASANFSATAFSAFKSHAAKADVIHYHFPYPFADMVHFLTRVRKPTVLTYHSDIVKQKNLLRLYRPLMMRFLGSVDRIVATSPNYVATSPVLQRFQEKVDVIPIGIDREAYPVPDTQRLAAWRARFGPRFFLFVGNLRYYKGLHVLLDALIGSSYPVVIVGNGREEAALKAQATRLGLVHVHFIGSIDEIDKVALLMQCEALLFPSHLRSEAFGISLLEAAMYGKPMVSCEIGTGTSWVNLANETGRVIPPNNPQALRQAIDWLWLHRTAAAQMGQAAERRYRDHFTAEQMVSGYVELYRSLCVRS
ncbi:glycosyl transferase family 1 [Robbsia andropogonis]|uniref:Glycosyl transferase family 1 n=2 Tax=Robbsia andropogonis TaxID=28092 RepID=A0A0F5K1N7_9BURK|nr:glycosyltransferase family 4 protein [Robbsia andropogonis]KKB63840.1 glycosyl transferase family 1 [Robbsia andropogonis]